MPECRQYPSPPPDYSNLFSHPFENRRWITYNQINRQSVPQARLFNQDVFVKIRTQLTLSLGFFILAIMAAIFALNYFVVRDTLMTTAQEELIRMEKTMYRSSQALLSTAINNYLRGITETNLEMVEVIYAEYLAGRMSEQEAKNAVQNNFMLQTVGTSGYLVAVERKDDRLFLDIHPFLRHQDCTDTDGCRQWDTVKNGYTEYDWQNPADNSSRKKAAYVLEFTPWNWVIGASSYRDEFVDLVKIEDLKRLIQPTRINASGYFFVFDDDYRVLIHPEFENIDGRTLLDSQGEMILEKLKSTGDGYLTYLWKNPSDQKERLKYAIIEKLEDYNWYLVATGYHSDVLEPITRLKYITMGIFVLVAGLFLLVIFRLSRNITRPLVFLEQAVTSFYRTKTPSDWAPHNIAEIDILGGAFAQMTRELTESMQSLQDKVIELAISEREKEENRGLLDSIINSMPSVIIGVDPRMRVIKWNQRAMQESGRRQEEVYGALLADVFPELRTHLEKIGDSIMTDTVNTITYEQPAEYGHTRISEMTVYPLDTEGNKGAVIRIDEVSDRVEMEQRLRQSQKMDAIGQLAGGIAHDFNNMLSGIMGAAELLRVKAEPTSQPLVKIISSAAGRASELIMKLMAFSRKDKVALSPVDMHTIIGDTVAILRRTIDKKIDLSLDLNAELHTIMGDWSQLQNGLLNIGINAGHAMPDGGTLSFASRALNLDEVFCLQNLFDITPGWYIEVTIRDTGCGIAPENMKSIFDPFFTTKKQGKGTGLGLAAVYGTVIQHGGAITVSSEIDRGTEFHLLLPLCQECQAEAIPDAKVITGRGCILIIDDEPIVRMTARMMLERLGYHTAEAQNGQEGLAIYREHPEAIDMVLLDMLMPVMDGSECFRTLRQFDPAVKIIISSGFSRDADLAEMKRQGLCAFIRKPYNLAELSREVARAITGNVGF